MSHIKEGKARETFYFLLSVAAEHESEKLLNLQPRGGDSPSKSLIGKDAGALGRLRESFLDAAGVDCQDLSANC